MDYLEKKDYLAALGEKNNLINPLLFVFFIITVTVVLYFFQYLVVSGTIAENTAIKYFFFDYESPNIYSLFLSNYIHEPQNPLHIRDNVISFVAISTLIGVLYFYLFPRFGIKMPGFFLSGVYLLNFFVVPFSVSSVSYIFREMGTFNDGIRYSIGFSGIVWAFLGFLFFLGAVFCLRVVSRRCEGRMADFRSMISVYFPFLFVIAFLIIFPVFFIIADVNTKNNLYAHLAGFTYGWLIPPLMGSFLLASDTKMRAANFVLIIVSFLLPFLITGFLMVS